MQVVTRSRTLCPCCRERVNTGTVADQGADGRIRHIVCAASTPKVVAPVGRPKALGPCEMDAELYQ